MFTRYSPTQFLLLLTGITDQACTIVAERISRNIEEMIGSDIYIEYSIASAIEVGIEER